MPNKIWTTENRDYKNLVIPQHFPVVYARKNIALTKTRVHETRSQVPDLIASLYEEQKIYSRGVIGKTKIGIYKTRLI